MNDPAWSTRIGNAAGKLSGNAEPALCLGKQEHAPIRRQSAALEGGRHFAAMYGWKRKREKAIVGHGDRGGSCPVQKDDKAPFL
jgi:hypothetical protein